MERDVLQHPVTRLIRKPDVAELDFAADAVETQRRRFVADGGTLVEDLEDPLGAGHRLLHDVVLLAQVADRLEEPLDVLEKCHHAAHGQHALKDLRAAVPDDRPGSDRRRHADERPEDREKQDTAQMGLEQVAIDGVKMLRRGAFSIE